MDSEALKSVFVDLNDVEFPSTDRVRSLDDLVSTMRQYLSSLRAVSSPAGFDLSLSSDSLTNSVRAGDHDTLKIKITPPSTDSTHFQLGLQITMKSSHYHVLMDDAGRDENSELYQNTLKQFLNTFDAERTKQHILDAYWKSAWKYYGIDSPQVVKTAKKPIAALLQHPPENTNKESHWYAKPLLVIFGVLMVAIYLVNYAIGNPPLPSFADEKAKGKYLMSEDRYEEAEKLYSGLLASDPYDLDLNYAYVQAHYDQKERTESQDSIIRTHFSVMAGHSTDTSEQAGAVSRLFPADSISSCVGNYGYGLCLSREEHHHDALLAFKRVQNKEQKYLNNSMGHVYLNLDDTADAEACFRKEIQLKGYIAGAHSNLFLVLSSSHRFQEMEKILATPLTRQALDSVNVLRELYVELFNALESDQRWSEIHGLLMSDSTATANCPNHVLRASYFANGELGKYLQSLYRHYAHSVNKLGFVGAFLILILWLLYLRKIDVFESEKMRYVIVTCILGMMFSILVFPISDYVQSRFGWSPSGNFVNDAFYFTISVGLLEEIVKIIPLLIGILWMKEEISEPIDYIIYASVSALGFGFMENLLYFHQDNLGVITGRALSAVFMHIFMSSTIAYALVLGKHQSRKHLILYFLAALIVASCIHGAYDFFLEDGVGLWRLTSMVILLFGGIQYGIYLTNALNASPLFNQERLFDTHKLKLEMIYGFSAVLIFEYIAIAFVGGASKANETLIASTVSGGFLVFWLSNRLGSMSLHQAEWVPGLGAAVVRGVVSQPVKDGLKSMLHMGGVFLLVAMIAYGTMKGKAYGAIYLIRIAWGFWDKKKSSGNQTLAQEA